MAFTDRPYREERDLTPTEFVALFAETGADSFSADPPNASLTYWDGDGTDAVASTVIVEITGDVTDGADNVIDGTADPVPVWCRDPHQHVSSLAIRRLLSVSVAGVSNAG